MGNCVRNLPNAHEQHSHHRTVSSGVKTFAPTSANDDGHIDVFAGEPSKIVKKGSIRKSKSGI